MVTLIFVTQTSCTDDILLESNEVLENEVNRFVWQGLNLYYFWQSEVPNLSDERFRTTEELTSFLNRFPTPEGLFNTLLFQEDRFSWIVDDYIALDNAFQGVSKSFGYEFKLLRVSSASNELFGYVEYVIPDSPAGVAGLKRGDIFTEVNGQVLTLENYVSLIIESDNYTLTLANFRSSELLTSNTEVPLTAVELVENPILLSKTLEVGNVRVGYFVYNQFINNNVAHIELNNVFQSFIQDEVSELVLDLRYNPGGSLFTCRLLASMIYGEANENTVLGSLIFNDKVSDLNTDFSFLSDIPIDSSSVEMNRLNIDRVFVLTTESTASASELIIAGLIPYMDVVVIGDQTTGKNESSITLYDSPEVAYSSNEPGDVNPNHRYAMQPIVSKLTNSEFLDYSSGLIPSVVLIESDFFDDLQPLGDVEETLLKEALLIISGTAREQKEWPVVNKG
ncbi:MAG: S41 family peptidase, partial [Bacteroidota bacterium]